MADQFSATPNLERDLNELERKMNELRTQYEMFFAGVDRKEPAALRKQVTAIVQKHLTTPIQNTGHKFRYNTLVGRYNSLTAYWTRVLREIEEGTYKREQFKQKLHEEELKSNEIDKMDAAKKTDKAAPKESGKAAADPIGQLFTQYVDARKKTNEVVAGLDRQMLEAQLKKQAAAIKEKFNCKRVTFKVVIEDGKAKIKAVPKND
jgi:hypothetical protein